MSLFRTKDFSNITPNDSSGLKRVLSLKDLTFLGIAAIIGAGSFSSLGEACFKAGPGVVIMFVICAIACGFTALCYAEFAGRIPVAGSAYTYAYASFGEIIAWIIGWALILEYSVGNIYVAFSWSEYFTNLLGDLHIHLPNWITSSYMEAKNAFASYQEHVATALAENKKLDAMNGDAKAWANAPMVGGLKIIFDAPALLINILITWLVLVGVKESKNVTNIMVYIKLVAVALVILVGILYVMPSNWFPASTINEGTTSFFPKGFGGVMGAVSAVFFAFVGFDAISTMAEEAKNPQKDLPKSMLYSLIICTGIYIALALVLTGMVNYLEFEGVSDPLAYVFNSRGVIWLKIIISICAVAAMTSVILVFQLGQPRIWYTMAKDGLMPKRFGEIHPKYKTPAFSTIITGLVVGIPILFVDKTFVLDFTSIGTLFAFVIVCGGVLLLPRKEKVEGRFHLPFINGKYYFAGIIVLALLIILSYYPAYFTDLLHPTIDNKGIILEHDAFVKALTLSIASFTFWGLMVVFSVAAFFKNWSLIPLLGLSSCLYLLTGMSAVNWFWFVIWFAIGLAVYFLYSRKNSKLNA
jgi:basic amino acid/polyamine antiporter, APA family